MRLIAGDAYGIAQRCKNTLPTFYLHITLEPNTRFGLPKEHAERGIYIAKGEIEVNGIFYGPGRCLFSQKEWIH